MVVQNKIISDAGDVCNVVLMQLRRLTDVDSAFLKCKELNSRISFASSSMKSVTVLIMFDIPLFSLLHTVVPRNPAYALGERDPKRTYSDVSN